MGCKTKLVLLSAFIVLVITLFMTGNACAAYQPDGATQNASGGWDQPSGTCPADNTKTSAPDCYTVRFPAYTSSTTCTDTATGGDIRVWANVCTASDGTPVNLKGLDRTAQMCAAKGGTWGAACVGRWTFNGSYSTYIGTDCLRCHGSAQYSQYADEDSKESYLKTGHKNTLRKVQPQGGPASSANAGGTPIYAFGFPWAGPDDAGILNIYTSDGTDAVNFSDASVTIAQGPNAGQRNLYWIYGGWMRSLPGFFYGTDAYDGARATFGTNNGYPCANCHATGFQDDSNPGIAGIGPNPWAPAEPLASFPGLSPVSSANARWDLYGVQCSRCHYATYPAELFFNVPSYLAEQPTSATMGMLMLRDHAVRINLCFSCHQNTSGTGVSTAAGVAGGDPTRIPTGVNQGTAYGRDFSADVCGDAVGNSFLNSVHGQFNGASTTGLGTMIKNVVGTYDLFDPTPDAYDPAGGMATKMDYGSTFTSYGCWLMPGYGYHALSTNADGSKITTSAQCTAAGGGWVAEPEGTCTTCHDVHQSFAIAGARPIKRLCEDCHVAGGNQSAVGAPTVDASNILHPTGDGTPFDATKYENSCVVCHMAAQAVTNGDQVSVPAHLWRINTNPSYNTFPTMAQFYGGSCSVHAGTLVTNNSFVKVYSSDASSADCMAAGGAWTATTKNRLAMTAPDTGEGYNNAVWVDLDLACGQCHGGSGMATHNGAPYISKADLSPYAAIMHGVPAGSVPPTVSATITAAGNAFAVGSLITLTDTSSDPVTGQTSLIVTVDWGDGSQSTGVGGGSFMHTYSIAGTYAIVETVTNGAGLSASQYTLETIAIPAANPAQSVTGTVYNSFDTSVPAAGVKVKLKNASGMIKQIVTTDGNGNYAFTNIPSPTTQTYTIIAKDPDHTRYSYTSATIAGGTTLPATANLKLAGFSILVSGGSDYPNAKVTVSGSKAMTKWTSTLAAPYIARFNTLDDETWAVTAKFNDTTCTVDAPSVTPSVLTLTPSDPNDRPTISVNIVSCP